MAISLSIRGTGEAMRAYIYRVEVGSMIDADLLNSHYLHEYHRGILMDEED